MYEVTRLLLYLKSITEILGSVEASETEAPNLGRIKARFRCELSFKGPEINSFKINN